jgi:hypothetical protein
MGSWPDTEQTKEKKIEAVSESKNRSINPPLPLFLLPLRCVCAYFRTSPDDDHGLQRDPLNHGQHRDVLVELREEHQAGEGEAHEDQQDEGGEDRDETEDQSERAGSLDRAAVVLELEGGRLNNNNKQQQQQQQQQQQHRKEVSQCVGRHVAVSRWKCVQCVHLSRHRLFQFVCTDHRRRTTDQPTTRRWSHRTRPADTHTQVHAHSACLSFSSPLFVSHCRSSSLRRKWSRLRRVFV